MKCWRDLSHECAGADCPMWMEGFDIPDIDDDDDLGLNDSRCALVLKEKIAIYRDMLEITDYFGNTDDFFNTVIMPVINDYKAASGPNRQAKGKGSDRNLLLPFFDDEDTGAEGEKKLPEKKKRVSKKQQT